MKSSSRTLGMRMCDGLLGCSRWLVLLGVLVRMALPQTVQSQGAEADERVSASAVVVTMEGILEWRRLLPEGTTVWESARTNQTLYRGDRLRTGPRSRALIRLSNGFTISVGPNSEAIPVSGPNHTGGPFLFRGLFYFFHRGQPGDTEVRTRTVAASIRGTEFHFKVSADGTSDVGLIRGELALANEFGQLDLHSGETSVIASGAAPAKTAKLEFRPEMQWTLYYPAILNLEDLDAHLLQDESLSSSLQSYREGDLLQALAKYPHLRRPKSDAEGIFLAALLLSVGDTSEAERLLERVGVGGTASDPDARVAAALGRFIEIVQLTQSSPAKMEPALATEWMSQSYFLQSKAALQEARAAARQAVASAPAFAFGWARLAELEFSFGDIDRSRAALSKSLQLGPRNAQAHAVAGFIAAAANQMRSAAQSFDAAIQIDPALGNAWLGRGLCQIRRGDLEAGRQDLQIAATLEPQRSLLRSYLAKAFIEEGQDVKAQQELEIAQALDPKDPTPWLYSALSLRRENRINEAIAALQQSKALNDNRRLFRSRFLLDQDRAVQGANLASTYADAGLREVSVREAVQAVHADYGSFASHLFLADSYNLLRDPQQINLRYETPWLSEYLLANLLAPVNAGTLSPVVTQQEYSRLFERNHLGFASETVFLSRGDWRQSAATYGIFDNTSFTAEESYRSERGERSNNDLDQLNVSFKARQQLTPKDSLYLQVIEYAAEGGDLRPLYDPATFSKGLRFKERQDPLVLAGYHHEWQPGVHTLLLGGRLEDSFNLHDPRQAAFFIQAGRTNVRSLSIDEQYESHLLFYTAEAQQIFASDLQTFILGGRVQTGDFAAQNRHSNPQFTPGAQLDSVRAAIRNPQTLDANSDRLTFYQYCQVRPLPTDNLSLLAGVSYDRLTFPENFRYPPFAETQKTSERLLPKAGLIWNPGAGFTLRFGYARDISGATFDQSFRLEPSQVAGFSYALRSFVPDAVVGPAAGERTETLAVALEENIANKTFLGITAQQLTSDLSQSQGYFVFPGVNQGRPLPAEFHQSRSVLDFEERSLSVTADQLLGSEWVMGLHYTVQEANLSGNLRSDGLMPLGTVDENAALHCLEMSPSYNHRSGFFAQPQVLWYAQSYHGSSAPQPDSDFWQFNLIVGYRFLRRKMEMAAGILNLSDQDYRLNPLNLTYLPPRERTFAFHLKFAF
ncbi:MAG: FecR domain-containing protein [Verrucomicrobiota bacterium]